MRLYLVSNWAKVKVSYFFETRIKYASDNLRPDDDCAEKKDNRLTFRIR